MEDNVCRMLSFFLSLLLEMYLRAELASPASFLEMETCLSPAKPEFAFWH